MECVQIGKATVHHGWGRDVLPTLEADSIDSVVCDPPYGLSKEPNMVEVLTHWLNGDDYTHDGGGFMGKSWDSFVPGPATWREIFRVLKPGGYALVFAGSRTVDLMAVSLRLAGFEIRDQIQWIYGSGFPKSLDISKALDKAAGAEREVTKKGNTKAQEFAGKFDNACSSTRERRDIPATEEAQRWEGWGTALKPAHEPIIVARKPLIGTVAANVLQYGTGGLNIDGCRVGGAESTVRPNCSQMFSKGGVRDDNGKAALNRAATGSDTGRFPANIIHDGSDEVLACFPDTKSGALTPEMNVKASSGWSGGSQADRVKNTFESSEGSAARFFYCAKASSEDRGDGNNHPTVKPQDLMRYLCRLVTPPGGKVLDSFAGSGSTGVAALAEGFHPVLVEQDAGHVEIIKSRLLAATEQGSLFDLLGAAHAT